MIEFRKIRHGIARKLFESHAMATQKKIEVEKKNHVTYRC